MYMNWKIIEGKIEVARWKWCLTTKMGKCWSRQNAQDKVVFKLIALNTSLGTLLAILHYA